MIVQWVNILVFKGSLAAQAGQCVQVIGPGGCVGGLEHGVVDVHAQLA